MTSIDFNFNTEGNDVVAHFADQVKGRTFLITGPTFGGIGSETIISLAHGHPAALILIGRSQSRAEGTISAVRDIDSSITIHFIETDLASLSSVRQAARLILDNAAIPVIDVIINNAAVMACPFELTVDGHELHLAAGHLGHFVLTNHILPKLLASSHPRLVNVSSSGNVAGGIRWADPDFSEPGSYNEWAAYGQVKTANILFSVALNQRYRASKGLRAFAVHPGSIQTGLQKYVTPELRTIAIKRIYGDYNPFEHPSFQPKTLQQGCATQLRAALDPALDVAGDGNEGIWLVDCQLSTDEILLAKRSVDPTDARRLWTWSEDLVGEKFDLVN